MAITIVVGNEKPCAFDLYIWNGAEFYLFHTQSLRWRITPRLHNSQQKVPVYAALQEK